MRSMMRMSAILSSWLSYQSSSNVAAFHISSPLRLSRSHIQSCLYATDATRDTLDLCSLAQEFIRLKNAAGKGESTLDPLFDICSPNVDLYGLLGENVRPGFISFFENHPQLYHELIGEPSVLGPTTVQYAFSKSWLDLDTNEKKIWKSIDPEKPRNKVERLNFDENGMLLKVSVVESNTDAVENQ